MNGVGEKELDLDIDIARIEKVFGRTFSEDTKKSMVSAWQMFFPQIADLIDAARKQGHEVGVHETRARFCNEAHKILGGFRAIFHEHGNARKIPTDVMNKYEHIVKLAEAIGVFEIMEGE